jgi:uncharacterized protein YggE
MTRHLFVCFVVLSVVLAAGLATGQTVDENTITVTGNGSADSEADWAEVSLSLHGQGPTAQEAVFNCADICDRASAALAKVGVAKENIKVGAPRISRAFNYGQMGPGDPGADINRFSAANTLTVRINKVNAATVYDDVAKLMDAVVTVKGAEMSRMDYMQGRIDNSDAVTFGVNDPKPLRARAMTDALDDAKQLAEIAAAGAQKKLGPLVMLSVRSTTSGPMPSYGYGGPVAPSKPARATVSVGITATYKLQ